MSRRRKRFGLILGRSGGGVGVPEARQRMGRRPRWGKIFSRGMFAPAKGRQGQSGAGARKLSAADKGDHSKNDIERIS